MYFFLCYPDHDLHQCPFQKLNKDLKLSHLFWNNVVFYYGQQIDSTIGNEWRHSWFLDFCKPWCHFDLRLLIPSFSNNTWAIKRPKHNLDLITTKHWQKHVKCYEPNIIVHQNDHQFIHILNQFWQHFKITMILI